MKYLLLSTVLLFSACQYDFSVKEEPIQIAMINVEGGQFDMGKDGNNPDESPAHTIFLDSFSLSATEISFNLYDQFASETQYKKPHDQGWGRGARPVINISWFEAAAFCNWLSQKNGYRPAYKLGYGKAELIHGSNGYRLPTEAEWEYAARGGSLSKGFRFSGSDLIDDVAWYSINTQAKTMPVAQLNPNELGFYDMSGNVYEWCNDWYDPEYYPHSPRMNPFGPDKGKYKSLRGGCWQFYLSWAEPQNRGGIPPHKRKDSVGFRVLLLLAGENTQTNE